MAGNFCKFTNCGHKWLFPNLRIDAWEVSPTHTHTCTLECLCTGHDSRIPCLFGSSLEPRHTSSRSFSLVTTYIVIAPHASYIVCASVHSSTSWPRVHVHVIHAHGHDGDSRGQAQRRRRRRFARSSPTTTTVNEIVGSVSANYRAVPGVHGVSLRFYLLSCTYARA